MSRPKRSHHVHVTLPGTPPPPKTWKTPTYRLDHYTIRRHIRVVTVQLHGERGNEKRTESVSLPLLPGVTDADLVRCTVWLSPNKWTVSFGMNVSQFGGKFSKALDAALLQALISPSQPSAAARHTQAQLSQHDQPTVADVPSFSQPFQPPPQQPAQRPPQIQPGQFQSFPSTSPQPSISALSNRRGFWQWYKTRTRKVQVSLGCGTLLAILLFFSCIGAALGSGNTATPSPTPSSSHQAAATGSTPTPTQAAQEPTPTPTQQPTPTPTLTPSPTPKPTPTTPKPTPTPVPQLAITFTCAQAVDYSYGKVCVHTQSGAALTITVTYCTGYTARSASLEGTVYANGSGNYEWDWTPETKCRGAATADVSASRDGQSTSNSDNFTVQ